MSGEKVDTTFSTSFGVDITVTAVSREGIPCEEISKVSQFPTISGPFVEVVRILKGKDGVAVFTGEAARAVNVVRGGRILFSPPSWEENQVSPKGFSPLDLQVLDHIVGGKSNKEIAREMKISKDTVRDHMRKMFDRTGVRTRSELAFLGTRLGLVEQDQMGRPEEPIDRVISSLRAGASIENASREGGMSTHEVIGTIFVACDSLRLPKTNGSVPSQ